MLEGRSTLVSHKHLPALVVLAAIIAFEFNHVPFCERIVEDLRLPKQTQEQ